MKTSLIIFYLLSLCQLGIIIIPIVNKRKEKAEKKLYNFGDKLLIALSIFGFAFALYLFMIASDQEDAKSALEKEYKKELNSKLAERDSIHLIRDSLRTEYYSNRIDSSYAKSISASNEALAKYNLVLIDSMNLVASKINIKSVLLPQLSLLPVNEQGAPIYTVMENNKKVLKVKLQTQNNVSYNIDLKVCLFEYNEQKTEFKIKSCQDFVESKFIIQGTIRTVEFDIKDAWSTIENGVLLFNGTFSADPENLNKIRFNEAYAFNFVEGKMGNQMDAKSLKNLEIWLKDKKYL